MSVEYESIPENLQGSALSAYWYMLAMMESSALDTKSTLDMHTTEAYYRLWNKMTGDQKYPRWIKSVSELKEKK